ncbi:MAG: type II secretion system F family protein [Rhodanobacteraceae bacterium]|nr:type II secretion system F family protein [Rhodanobacteraceae bacterium]MBL0042609.1 type II secretion system F family protein [Xanthomonadales bacterium]MBP6078733.1 type II secretion system F family protein [Xanthomonadales bacterium]MBP7623969.1 type II secretion system F family protein [Xanthomonadales bacterium]
MPIFKWEGTDKRGKKMHGEVRAKNANLAKADLRKQGINPSKVAERKAGMFAKRGKITAQDIATFSRQIATMMSSGVPMVQAFDLIASGTKNAALADMLNDIKSNIEGGSSLHEAIGRHPYYFDELYRNLVKAGESAGVLDTVLDTVASYKENIEALKGKIKKALFYPAAVIAVAIIVSAILLIFVVPQFKSVFASFGADLPAFTLMVLHLSEFVVGYWWAILAIGFGLSYASVQLYKRSDSFQHTMARLMLKLPVIGGILHASAVARFSRTLALTFKSGVPLVEALETVAGATGNIIYSQAVLKMKEDVAVGYSLAIAMRQVNLFPTMVEQMTSIGEEAGALDTMLFKVAEFYEREVNNAVDTLTSLLEPFIIVIIGGMVGSLVIAMYLPIFKLGAVV